MLLGCPTFNFWLKAWGKGQIELVCQNSDPCKTCLKNFNSKSKTAGYNGLCNLTQVNKVCVCVCVCVTIDLIPMPNFNNTSSQFDILLMCNLLHREFA